MARAERTVQLRSQTAGDTDGIDLWLDGAAAGRIIFESAAGRAEANLADLRADRRAISFAMGGVDMQVRIERYPKRLTVHHLNLSLDLAPPSPGQGAPYLVKVVQEDGHTAWSSPIYLGG